MKPQAIIKLKKVSDNKKGNLLSLLIVCFGAVAVISIGVELHGMYEESHYKPAYSMGDMIKLVAKMQKAEDIKRAKVAAAKVAAASPSPSPSAPPVAEAPSAPAFDEKAFFNEKTSSPSPSTNPTQ